MSSIELFKILQKHVSVMNALAAGLYDGKKEKKDVAQIALTEIQRTLKALDNA